MKGVWRVFCLAALLAVAMGGCSNDAGTTTGVGPGTRSAARLPGEPVDTAIGAGSLWVLTQSTHHRPGHLVRIDLHSRRLVSSTEVHGPQAVALGWESVWVVEISRNRVLRIDARSGRLLATIRLRLERPVSDTPDGFDFFPFDIAAGEGAVWVSTARGSVARIDPDTNRVAEQIAIPLESGAGIAAGEGAVWVGGSLNGVIRIDPETGEKRLVPIEGPRGRRLTVGEFALTADRVWALGGWAAPLPRRRGYVVTAEAALADLSPRGSLLGTVPLPAAVGVVPSTGNWVWLSGWRSRDLYVVRPSFPYLQEGLRLPRPARVLAIQGDRVWIAWPDNTLVRLPPEGPG